MKDLSAENPVERMGSTLAGVEMVAEVPISRVHSFVEEVIRAVESAGFVAERRAEGYALMPAGVNVPTHLRIGVFGSMVSFWIRGAFNLLESADRLGVEPQELFDALMDGVRRAAEIFRRMPQGAVKIRVP